MCVCGNLCRGVCWPLGVARPAGVRRRVETELLFLLWTPLGSPSGAISLVHNHPQQAIVIVAAAYGGVVACANRSATAICSSQLFGAVYKRQPFVRGLGE